MYSGGEYRIWAERLSFLKSANDYYPKAISLSTIDLLNSPLKVTVPMQEEMK